MQGKKARVEFVHVSLNPRSSAQGRQHFGSDMVPFFGAKLQAWFPETDTGGIPFLMNLVGGRLRVSYQHPVEEPKTHGQFQGISAPVWVWLKIKELGQTAGFSLWFHLPFGAILVQLFEPQPNDG